MSTPTIQLSDSGIYYIHWTDNGRSKRVSTRTKNLAAAKAFLGQWLLMEQSGASTERVVTVGDLWGLYSASQLPRMASQETALASWKRLGPHFGSMLVGQVTEVSVQQYVVKRRAGRLGPAVKDATIRRELSYLRAILNFAADRKRRIISVDSLPAFDLPAASEPRDRWLTHDEVKALMAAAADLRRGEKLSRLERFLWLALETAGRDQALRELTWDRVDWETNVIHLEVPGRRKTSKGRSSVPISDALRPVLERAFAEREDRFVVGGQKMWDAVQKATIKAGLAKAGRASDRSATGISPHTLRHTAATHMARRGVPLWIIAKVLGNSLYMVEKVYAKHCPDDLRSAVNLISGGAHSWASTPKMGLENDLQQPTVTYSAQTK